jgi:hypothetical protein
MWLNDSIDKLKTGKLCPMKNEGVHSATSLNSEMSFPKMFLKNNEELPYPLEYY